MGGKRHGVGVERRNENTGLRTPSAGGYRCAFIFKPGFSVVEIPQFHKTSRTVTDVLAGGGPIPTLVPPCPPRCPHAHPVMLTQERRLTHGGGSCWGQVGGRQGAGRGAGRCICSTRARFFNFVDLKFRSLRSKFHFQLLFRSWESCQRQVPWQPGHVWLQPQCSCPPGSGVGAPARVSVGPRGAAGSGPSATDTHGHFRGQLTESGLDAMRGGGRQGPVRTPDSPSAAAGGARPAGWWPLLGPRGPWHSPCTNAIISS